MIPLELLYHGLEKAHFYYGVPHMFHDIAHWVINGVGVYRAGQIGLKARVVVKLLKRIQKVCKTSLCFFKR